MTKKVTTILFDLDGTLIDTNELITSSFLHTLNTFFPNKYEREDVIPFNGPPLMDTFTKIDPNRAEEMMRVYRTYNHEHHDSFVKAFGGVFETLQKLKENKYKLAIVSSKLRETALMGLELTNLKQFFEVIIALDDVECAKPDPEPIERALQALYSSADEAIMIGDNYHDIMAGKNAGTYTAGVAWTIQGKEFLLQYQPDFMLEKMIDLLSILEGNHR